jgi:hypothetical protein
MELVVEIVQRLQLFETNSNRREGLIGQLFPVESTISVRQVTHYSSKNADNYGIANWLHLQQSQVENKDRPNEL